MNGKALQRASGATDILDRARVVGTLEEALEGVSHLCATAMTARDFGPPTRAPREHLARLVHDAANGQPQVGVAFLFGPERFGMANADVYRCHVALQIPTDPDFGSLNLAAAIQVIAYEWRQALGAFALQADADAEAAVPADAQAVAGLLAHWERTLAEIGFLDPASPKKLMPRLNQLVNRARLTPEEIHILRGVAKAVSAGAPGAKREI